MTRAVILAAGMGTRMGEIGLVKPKCLLRVDGTPLLGHLHASLTAAGVSEVTVVAGFGAPRVRRWVRENLPGVRVVRNADFANTGAVASLARVRRWLSGHDFLVLNGDVLHAAESVRRMMAHQSANAVLIDPTTDRDLDEYQVVIDSDGFVTGYQRGAWSPYSVGQSAQLLKVGAEDGPAFLAEVARLAETGEGSGFPLDAYPVLMAGRGLHAVYTAGVRWWEVDTPADLRRCRRQWAQLARRRESRRIDGSPDLLSTYGLQMLTTVIDQAADLGVEVMLGWGSLLGAVRSADLLPGDHDVDLIVRPEHGDRLGLLRDRLVEVGMRVRRDLPHKLSLRHREHDELWIDIDVLFDRGSHVEIINTTLPDRTMHYRFSRSVFDGGSTSLRIGDLTVPGPADPEAFLTQVYGDWRTPADKVNFLYGPLNVIVELHPGS